MADETLASCLETLSAVFILGGVPRIKVDYCNDCMSGKFPSRPVASENSDSCVSMVQSAKDRLRNNVSERLDRTCPGCVLAKRVRPHLIIIAGVFRKNAPKMFFVEHDHVVRTLAPRRPDQALN